MNLVFQATAFNDLISTEVIPEFPMSPEETKVVRNFLLLLLFLVCVFCPSICLADLFRCQMYFLFESVVNQWGFFFFSFQARLKLLPHKTGELHVLGVIYNLGAGEEDNNTGEGTLHSLFIIWTCSGEIFRLFLLELSISVSPEHCCFSPVLSSQSFDVCPREAGSGNQGAETEHDQRGEDLCPTRIRPSPWTYHHSSNASAGGLCVSSTTATFNPLQL